MLSILFRFYLQIELRFSQLHLKSQLSNYLSGSRDKKSNEGNNLEVFTIHFGR